jgi:hypothetical protein
MFDHDDVDRTAVAVAEELRKLCSVIGPLSDCLDRDNCWYSHEAQGVGCMQNGLRATNSKDLYCFYEHTNNGVVVPTEPIIGGCLYRSRRGGSPRRQRPQFKQQHRREKRLNCARSR